MTTTEALTGEATTPPPTQYDAITTLYRIPNSEALLLDVLLRRVLLPIQVIIDEKIATNREHARVVCSKLRKHLKAKNIALNCKPNVGYWIDPIDKKTIQTELAAHLAGQ